MTPRDEFGRHSLHGLNLFLNQMFQQFPILLGIRQIDYAGAIEPSTQPALVTGAESMLRMARHESAEIELTSLAVDSTTGEVEANVLVTNKVGHFLPSGVGFRRVFVEFVVDGRARSAMGLRAYQRARRHRRRHDRRCAADRVRAQ